MSTTHATRIWIHMQLNNENYYTPEIVSFELQVDNAIGDFIKFIIVSSKIMSTHSYLDVWSGEMFI